MASRSNRWGQFSCTPGERVTMCSCIRVGPSSVVAIGPSAVSTVVAMSTSRSYRERLGRHCPNEGLHLGLVVIVMHAGADARVDSARGQIDPRQASRTTRVSASVRLPARRSMNGGSSLSMVSRRKLDLAHGRPAHREVAPGRMAQIVEEARAAGLAQILAARGREHVAADLPHIIREIGVPGVTRTPGTQFRKLLSVVEVLDISIAASGLAGPRRAWTAAAARETGGRSAVREGLEGLQSLPCASCLGGWIR